MEDKRDSEVAEFRSRNVGKGGVVNRISKGFGKFDVKSI